jgi:excisionase family DNA binding protein
MRDSFSPSILMKPPSEIMTISEVAELLKLSETSVRRMCERKELPAVKFGSQWRIRRKDVLAMWDQPA